MDAWRIASSILYQLTLLALLVCGGSPLMINNNFSQIVIRRLNLGILNAVHIHIVLCLICNFKSLVLLLSYWYWKWKSKSYVEKNFLNAHVFHCVCSIRVNGMKFTLQSIFDFQTMYILSGWIDSCYMWQDKGRVCGYIVTQETADIFKPRTHQPPWK